MRATSVQIGCVCAALCLIAAPAFANDGGIAYGGSPGLLAGHPSVTMTSEVVHLDVGEKELHVDCQFVFTNHGKACTVRMGFPDQGFGASDPDEEVGPEGLHSPPKTTFDSFVSYVEGKKVATKLIRSDKLGQFWHAKTVPFAAGQTLHVRDVYSLKVGGGIATIGKQTGQSDQIGYVLHTGASWHGNIGRTEVIVTFKSTAFTSTPVPTPLAAVAKKQPDGDLMGSELTTTRPNMVVCSGSWSPTASGKTLKFVRTNWKPTKKDDIDLFYNYRVIKQPSQPKEN